ncbi:MAG: phosphatase PAP2 family protein [Mobilicoccus sp.]|nr:phosphatase PAP2 family protein [Mobilicoccus sp.]
MRRARAIGIATSLLGAVGFALSLLLVWTHLGQRADERSRWSAGVPLETSQVLQGWLHLVSVEFIAVVLVVAVLLALARRRAAHAVSALLVVVGANVTTQVLKAGLPRPDFGIGSGNTLPSGHVTVVTSLVLAAVFVVPSRLRPVVALLAGGAGTLTGAATLVERWHRPSDVIAGYGVCAIFAGVGLLIAARSNGRGPRSRRREPGLLGYALLSLTGATLAGAFLLTGGLVVQGESTNLTLAAVVLGAMGVICAGVVAFTAWGLASLTASEQTSPRPSRVPAYA